MMSYNKIQAELWNITGTLEGARNNLTTNKIDQLEYQIVQINSSVNALYAVSHSPLVLPLFLNTLFTAIVRFHCSVGPFGSILQEHDVRH